MARKDLSLYVHIPFCEKKCNYCAFNSFVCASEGMEEYLTLLKKEITMRAKEYGGKYHLNTVYIGGGTPSILHSGEIRNLLRHINKEFVVLPNAEITIEINPGTITEEKAREYMEAGINRFSVGLQSSMPHILKLMGRIHTNKDFVFAVKLLQAAGAENISADIMLGFPHQTKEDVIDSVEYALKQGVGHISTYLLELENGTNITKLVNANMLKLPTSKESIEMYNAVHDTLTKNGFYAYELSNYSSSPEFESRHNKVYWNRGEYLGVGLSSHSLIGNTRFANTGDIKEYKSHLKEGKIALEYKDELTNEEIKEEIIMLSLRTTNGLNCTLLKEQTGYDILKEKKENIKNLIKNGYMVITEDEKLKLTIKGFMVINKIIEELAID